MVVMNDRSQAGSAYSKGRIEYILHRYGTTNDGLGMGESMIDETLDRLGPNITASFFVTFTKNREIAMEKIIRRHMLLQN